MAVKIRYHMPMSVTPIRPEESVDEETQRILQERDATFDEDKEMAVDAREATANIRRRLKTLQQT
jgi:hypothetical protein